MSKIVALKDGSEVDSGVVYTVGVTLKEFWRRGPVGLMGLYDLRERARNADYPFFSSDTEQEFTRLGLLNKDGSMHEDIRAVILNSFKGEGLQMALVSPVSAKE